MIQPLIDIANLDDPNPQVIWWERVDKRFLIEVRETDQFGIGQFLIFDLLNNNKCIFGPEDVGLSFGGVYGPDPIDIEEWKMNALHIIDNLNGNN
jgi:hypothetical protein